MTQLMSSVYIDATPDHVWSIISDFGNVYRYNPSVPTSHSTGDDAGGLGATRHCDLAPFGSLEEKIVEFEEGSHLVVDIFETEKVPPFEHSIARLTIEPEGDGTRFRGKLDYQLKGGLLGRALNGAGAQRSFEKAWTRFAAGLKYYAETGNEVATIKDVDTSAVEAVDLVTT